MVFCFISYSSLLYYMKVVTLFVVGLLLSFVKSGEHFDNIPYDHESVDLEGLRIVWDFIVVGAGASGNVVATRYSFQVSFFYFLCFL